MTAAGSPASYVVQPGESLAGIAARFAVRGGWPALYAANQRRIGPDPDAIRPGTVVVLPGVRTPVRYTVAAGDTLAGIAAALSVRGGWPALYAANQRRIGPDPDAIRPGTVLAIPQRAPPSPPRPAPVPRQSQTPRPSAPAGGGHRPGQAGKGAPGAGMPPWLKILLLAAGLLIAVTFLAELVRAGRRRRQAAIAAAVQRRKAQLGPGPTLAPPGPHMAQPGPGPAPRPGAGKAHIVLADHDRLIVTRSQPDQTVCVLRPPGTDPKAILRTARLVLPEHLCRALAARLGMPASWPIILADHDRLVVTRSIGDGTVCVLRPPGRTRGDLAGGAPGAAGGPVRRTGRPARDTRRFADGIAGASADRPGPTPRPRAAARCSGPWRISAVPGDRHPRTCRPTSRGSSGGGIEAYSTRMQAIDRATHDAAAAWAAKYGRCSVNRR